MTNKKGTKRSLLMSALAMLLCISMLIGSTFAWFTDSVTSAGNIIKSGTLDVEMYWADGKEDPNAANWQDASKTKIFDYDNWEPGYTVARHIAVKNEGTLALKYQLAIVPTGEVTDLAKVIDVYYIKNATQLDERADMSAYSPVGTLDQLINNEISVIDVMPNGKLAAGEGFTATLVLKMQESATNEYQDKSIGTTFSVQLLATQFTSEKDSFDNLYDINSAAFTVEEANAQLALNKDVTLVNCKEPNGILYVPAGYTGTLTLVDSAVASIQELPAVSTLSLEEESATILPGETDIVIRGNVVVKATENGMSAITGTKLNITGNGHLIAVGKGQAAFGIGGMTTESITISGVTIDYVEGGYAYGVGSDTKYYKDAPEGGAAIGSGYNGAEITLDNVTVVKAIGGSKAAGIGARYHTGVTVTIKNSAINYVEGGVSAAAIGSSRVSNGASENGTTINITKSTITAVGGAYGAGIGSGYDTHCQSNQPLCTINIDGSTINATGGKYAAGVGSGYHNAALTGEIKNSTVKATSGDKFYKATYSTAMDIGFGVVDPGREGVQEGSIVYNGVALTYKDAPVSASNKEEIGNALAAGEDVALSANITVSAAEADSNGYGATGIHIGDGQTLYGNGKSVGVNAWGTWDSAINITSGTIKNVTVNSGMRGIFVNHNGTAGKVYLENVVIDGPVYTISCDQGTNSGLEATKSTFNGWTSYAATIGDVKFTDCSFGEGQGYAFCRPYAPTTFVGCDFAAGYVLDAQAAVTFENCTIGGQPLTAENLATLVAYNIANATVK